MNTLSLVHRISAARVGTPPHPGIILFHGLGSDELDLLGLAAKLDPRLYAVSARAPNPYHGGGFTWYDLDNDGPGLGSTSIEAALQVVDEFLGEVVETYPVDRERLYLGGFSMGAAIAGAVALLQAEKVAGVVMASGYLPPDNGDRYRLKNCLGKPVFQGHGVYDSVVPLQGARLTRDFLRSAGVDLTYKEYPIAHQVSSEELQDLASWFDERI